MSTLRRKIKDFKYGVKKLKLKHLSNGYFTGGTYVVILGMGVESDAKKVICHGFKMDLMRTELWQKLREVNVARIGGTWHVQEDKHPLYILLDTEVRKWLPKEST